MKRDDMARPGKCRRAGGGCGRVGAARWLERVLLMNMGGLHFCHSRSVSVAGMIFSRLELCHFRCWSCNDGEVQQQ